VERPFAPCSIKPAQVEVTGVLSDLHLAECRFADRLSPGVVGSSQAAAYSANVVVAACERVFRDVISGGAEPNSPASRTCSVRPDVDGTAGNGGPSR
jgi:hypothetical protein